MYNNELQVIYKHKFCIAQVNDYWKSIVMKENYKWKQCSLLLGKKAMKCSTAENHVFIFCWPWKL